MTTLDGLADLNGVTTTMFNLDNPFGQSPLPMETKYGDDIRRTLEQGPQHGTKHFALDSIIPDSKSFDDSSTIVSSLSLDPFLSATNPPLFNDPKLPAVLPLQSSNLMMMPPTMMTPQLTGGKKLSKYIGIMNVGRQSSTPAHRPRVHVRRHDGKRAGEPSRHAWHSGQGQMLHLLS